MLPPSGQKGTSGYTFALECLALLTTHCPKIWGCTFRNGKAFFPFLVLFSLVYFFAKKRRKRCAKGEFSSNWFLYPRFVKRNKTGTCVVTFADPFVRVEKTVRKTFNTGHIETSRNQIEMVLVYVTIIFNATYTSQQYWMMHTFSQPSNFE